MVLKRTHSMRPYGLGNDSISIINFQLNKNENMD